jgi:signal recognition particle subunit SRP54
MPQIARGYTAPMGQNAMAKARLMGYSTAPAAGGLSDAERKAIKERRKREKQNKKKNRKK